MTEEIKSLQKDFFPCIPTPDVVNEIFKKTFNTNDPETLKELYDLYYTFAKENDHLYYNNHFEYISNMYKLDGKLQAKDYKTYLDFVVGTKTFKTSDRIIQKMLNSKRLDNALGFSTPQLVLDPSVKNFYDFKSPKMRTGTALTVENGKLVREGKIVDNPESSFDVINYHPETEGKELPMRVPVAE